MKNLDDFITDIVNKEINEPQEYENSIRTAFNKNSYKKLKFNKIIATSCSLLILATSVVYATDIIKEYIGKYFYNFNEGIDTAIENDYFDEVETEYVSSTEPNTIINEQIIIPEIKVKNMVMDDYSLCFTFTLKIDSNIDNIQRVNLNKVLITDENNSILYCDNKEIFDNYCKNHNLNYKFLESNDHYISGNGLNWYITDRNNDLGTIDLMFNIINDREQKYPNSKILNIQIGKISLKESTDPMLNDDITIEGNWNMLFHVNNKFYDRKPTNYIIKNSNYSDIIVTEASLSYTGFDLKFSLPHNPSYLETDSEKVKEEKINEFHEYYTDTDTDGKIIPNPILDCYIENEIGQKFYQPSSDLESKYNSDFLSNNFFYYKDTFTLTKANQTDTLKLYFKLNLPDIQKDICIELEKEN